MSDTATFILLMAILIAIVALGSAYILSDRREQVCEKSIDFLAYNFIALCDEARKPEQLVTVRSLLAARGHFPENQAEIAEIIAKIASIGHDITDDPRVKMAVAMAVSPVAPVASAVVASSLIIWGIDRRDLAEARE